MVTVTVVVCEQLLYHLTLYSHLTLLVGQPTSGYTKFTLSNHTLPYLILSL